MNPRPPLFPPSADRYSLSAGRLRRLHYLAAEFVRERAEGREISKSNERPPVGWPGVLPEGSGR